MDAVAVPGLVALVARRHVAQFGRCTFVDSEREFKESSAYPAPELSETACTCIRSCGIIPN
jgi:hypothetical protein